MTYSEKLRDPRWQKKRLHILERDNWRCVLCGCDTKNLQVHHVVYRRIDPWDYPDEFYQTLCEPCHVTRQQMMDSIVDAMRICLKPIPNERLSVFAVRIFGKAMHNLGDDFPKLKIT